MLVVEWGGARWRTSRGQDRCQLSQPGEWTPLAVGLEKGGWGIEAELGRWVSEPQNFRNHLSLHWVHKRVPLTGFKSMALPFPLAPKVPSSFGRGAGFRGSQTNYSGLRAVMISWRCQEKNKTFSFLSGGPSRPQCHRGQDANIPRAQGLCANTGSE